MDRRRQVDDGQTDKEKDKQAGEWMTQMSGHRYGQDTVVPWRGIRMCPSGSREQRHDAGHGEESLPTLGEHPAGTQSAREARPTSPPLSWPGPAEEGLLLRSDLEDPASQHEGGKLDEVPVPQGLVCQALDGGGLAPRSTIKSSPASHVQPFGLRSCVSRDSLTRLHSHTCTPAGAGRGCCSGGRGPRTDTGRDTGPRGVVQPSGCQDGSPEQRRAGEGAAVPGSPLPGATFPPVSWASGEPGQVLLAPSRQRPADDPHRHERRFLLPAPSTHP